MRTLIKGGTIVTAEHAQYIVGNAFYNLTPDCSIGLEYLYGRRSNMNREDGQANRINAMIQYNF